MWAYAPKQMLWTTQLQSSYEVLQAFAPQVLFFLRLQHFEVSVTRMLLQQQCCLNLYLLIHPDQATVRVMQVNWRGYGIGSSIFFFVNLSCFLTITFELSYLCISSFFFTHYPRKSLPSQEGIKQSVHERISFLPGWHVCFVYFPPPLLQAWNLLFIL